MSTRSRVENRAHLIYDFLVAHLGSGFTIAELCKHLRINNGATTRAAITRARDLATEAGLHFPPAVPQNGQRYMVTKLAEDAVDPTLQMGRIGAGVRHRGDVGYAFIKRERAALPPELRPLVTAWLEVKDQAERSAAAIQRSFDDMVLAVVKARRDSRKP
ncbi:MAG: hypothetical protein ACRD0W_21010 [Acidimicrobiales bacterium]